MGIYPYDDEGTLISPEELIYKVWRDGFDRGEKYERNLKEVASDDRPIGIPTDWDE